MYIDLKVPAYTVKQKVTYTLNSKEELENFPILTIDKDSYIVSSVAICTIDSKKEKRGYNLQIGKHSSLAEDIEFLININKDYHKTCMGLITAAEQTKAFEPTIRFKGQILIQNDCWIGHGVKILSGVTIHNGAIVGAGSVVTKDVPPYAIAAGNPAKVVAYRFDEKTIDALQKIAWWNWSSDLIAENIDLLRDEPYGLIQKFLPQVNRCLQQIDQRVSPISKMSNGKVYAFMVDIDEQYALAPYVIKEFCECFDNKDEQLVLYIPYDRVNREQIVDLLCEELAKYEDKNCFIQIIDSEGVELSDIIRNVDYFISSRNENMVYASCLVDLYGKEMISGVDCPIFS